MSWINMPTPKRSYITLDDFSADIFKYTTETNNFKTEGFLTPIGGTNCPKGRFLYETGRKIYPGANPGVRTFMVSVFDPVTFINGYIDPNSKIFSPMNTDKSYNAQTNDSSNGIFGINPNGNTESDKGPGILTLANCEISGTLNVKNEYFQYGYVMLPKFSVIMWSGQVGAIPSGWILCDGSTVVVNGQAVTSPDLRGRFVLSYGQGPLNFANTTVGAIGGEQKHTLTVAEIPSHTHTQTTINDDFNNTGTYANFTMPSYPQSDSAGTITWTGTINATGGGNGHNNMPPYYVLCYIMKGF